MIITTALKSRTFREIEKDRLYDHLRNPLKKKRDEICDNFSTWLDDNIIPRVIDPDLLTLGKKSYCMNSTTRFKIHPKKFGLDERYKNPSTGNPADISLAFTNFSKKYKCAVEKGCYSIDISDYIISKCNPEEIEQVKYFLFEKAKAEFEYTYYGLGTFILPMRGYGSKFRDIRTWGNLYSRDPEMYEKLYNLCAKKSTGEDVSNFVNPEIKLLSSLKTILGY